MAREADRPRDQRPTGAQFQQLPGTSAGSPHPMKSTLIAIAKTVATTLAVLAVIRMFAPESVKALVRI